MLYVGRQCRLIAFHFKEMRRKNSQIIIDE